MKNKAIVVSFVTLLALVFALNAVVATDIVKIVDVEVNDVSIISGKPVAGIVSDIVPVEVMFTANQDATDVRVRVYIEGFRDEISEITSRFHIVNDSTYIKRFSLRLPSSVDLDDLTEGLSVVVRISAKGETSFEKEYPVVMQRNLYNLNFLSVELPNAVVAGSTFPIDVVIENNGNERLENVYVKVVIPDLGVSKKVFVGDLDEEDDREADDDRDHLDREDTVYKKVFITIPRNAVPGNYNVEVEAYNFDAFTSVTKRIDVMSIEAGVLPTITSKAISVGETATFDVVLVNPNDRMVVYTITPEESRGLIVEVVEPVVAVSGDSSRTITIKVKATDSVEEGTHIVTVNVNSVDTGLSRQVNFNVNVEDTSVTSNSVVVLTVILAIIFVVLLIVLIVLLTKKPAENEEFGETSYY